MVKDRIQIEDALKHLHTRSYAGRAATVESMAGVLGVSLDQGALLAGNMEEMGFLVRREDRLDLTAKGTRYALHVIRAHRLYETYLARETGFAEEQWHPRAEVEEHKMSDADLDRMARELGDPRFDPHGDPIPTREGSLPPLLGRSLLGCPLGWEGRVVHIEDEPDAVYAEIVAGGLAAGMHLRVTAADSRTVRINAEGRDLVFSTAMAANVRAEPLTDAEVYDDAVMRLASLKQGQEAEVVGLSASCRGPERNRFLDLGIVPGTPIAVDLLSPSGNPIAYRIRGAAIALRTEQAERVLIREVRT